MVMVAQSRPWTATAGREIADGNGNVVQYTMENLGQICLAVNAYERLVSALASIDEWLGQAIEARTGDAEMREAVKAAIGRIGCEQIAALVEANDESNPELNRRIAAELSVPEVDYTGSTDAAMTLVPKGWKYSVSDHEQLNITTNEMETIFTIEVRSTLGQTTSGSNAGFSRALAAASLRAWDIARAA